jgi:hypothetical protein
MLPGLAAAAALAMAVTQWGGVASAASNTKPHEVVVVPYSGKGAASKKGAGLRPSFQGGTRVSPVRPAKTRRLQAR